MENIKVQPSQWTEIKDRPSYQSLSLRVNQSEAFELWYITSERRFSLVVELSIKFLNGANIKDPPILNHVKVPVEFDALYDFDAGLDLYKVYILALEISRIQLSAQNPMLPLELLMKIGTAGSDYLKEYFIKAKENINIVDQRNQLYITHIEKQ